MLKILRSDLNKMLLFPCLAAFLVFSIGCEEKDTTENSKTNKSITMAAPINGRVKIRVENEGYNPLAVNVKVNEEVVLEFTRVSDSPCGERVLVPDHNIDVALPLNQPIDIRITPKETGTLAFMCGMRMMKGTIIVQ